MKRENYNVQHEKESVHKTTQNEKVYKPRIEMCFVCLLGRVLVCLCTVLLAHTTSEVMCDLSK